MIQQSLAGSASRKDRIGDWIPVPITVLVTGDKKLKQPMPTGERIKGMRSVCIADKSTSKRNNSSHWRHHE